MTKQRANISIPITLFILLIVAGVVFFLYKLLFPQKDLPVYNPYNVNPDLVDESLHNKRSNHKIADFLLINQNGDTITYEDYKDKIYVANFFFTRCKTICIPMTSNMATVQKSFIEDNEVMFLSHSVTPIIDSVSVLREYADLKGVIDSKWNLATGSKQHIYELARKSYFAVLNEGDGELQDFIHTEKFILIDKKRQIRGFYDGTNIEEMERLKNDIVQLKEEYN